MLSIIGNIPWAMFDVKTCNFNPGKSKLPASHICSLFREHLNIHAGSTFIFTDGSKLNYVAAITGQSEYSAYQIFHQVTTQNLLPFCWSSRMYYIYILLIILPFY